MAVEYNYRLSKSGVNMLMKCLAVDLKNRGITSVALHPGWVRTDMGGAAADIAPEQSVAGLVRVIDALTLDQSGKYIAYDGSELPW